MTAATVGPGFAASGSSPTTGTEQSVPVRLPRIVSQGKRRPIVYLYAPGMWIALKRGYAIAEGLR